LDPARARLSSGARPGVPDPVCLIDPTSTRSTHLASRFGCRWYLSTRLEACRTAQKWAQVGAPDE